MPERGEEGAHTEVAKRLVESGSARMRMVQALLLLLALILTGLVGFAVLEGLSPFDALYLTVITLATVGYGDISPQTTAGRSFAIFFILAGIVTLSYNFTRLGQLAFEGELRAILGKRRIKEDIEELRDHFIVCGYGRVGKPVADGFQKEGVPFIIIEKDPENEAALQEAGYLYVIGDATQESTLRTAKIDKARGLLSLLESNAENLYVALEAKELNKKLRVIARATDAEAAHRLERGGADKVVTPYEIAGRHVLNVAIRPSVVELMDVATDREHLALTIEELRVPAMKGAAKVTVQSLIGDHLTEVIVVAIKKRDGSMSYKPKGDAPVAPGDALVLIGGEVELRVLKGLVEK